MANDHGDGLDASAQRQSELQDDTRTRDKAIEAAALHELKCKLADAPYTDEKAGKFMTMSLS